MTKIFIPYMVKCMLFLPFEAFNPIHSFMHYFLKIYKIHVIAIVFSMQFSLSLSDIIFINTNRLCICENVQ